MSGRTRATRVTSGPKYNEPFGSMSHAKGNFVDTICLEAKKPNSDIRKCCRVQLINNSKRIAAFMRRVGCLNLAEGNDEVFISGFGDRRHPGRALQCREGRGLRPRRVEGGEAALASGVSRRTRRAGHARAPATYRAGKNKNSDRVLDAVASHRVCRTRARIGRVRFSFWPLQGESMANLVPTLVVLVFTEMVAAERFKEPVSVRAGDQVVAPTRPLLECARVSEQRLPQVTTKGPLFDAQHQRALAAAGPSSA